MAEAPTSEARAWLHRADDDLGAAGKLLTGTDPYPAVAAYHCQQAAEKALKALIANTGARIPKTHDLRLLMEHCARIDPSLETLRETCDELTPYATEFRYPGDSPDPDLEEVRDALARAGTVVTAIAGRIGVRGSGNKAG